MVLRRSCRTNTIGGPAGRLLVFRTRNLLSKFSTLLGRNRLQLWSGLPFHLDIKLRLRLAGGWRGRIGLEENIQKSKEESTGHDRISL